MTSSLQYCLDLPKKDAVAKFYVNRLQVPIRSRELPF